MRMNIQGSLEKELFRMSDISGIPPSRIAKDLIEQALKQTQQANSQQEKQYDYTQHPN